MRRWITGDGKYGSGRFGENLKIDVFTEAFDKLCEEHGFEIWHEDSQGAFLIVPYDGGGCLDSALDCTEEKQE